MKQKGIYTSCLTTMEIHMSKKEKKSLPLDYDRVMKLYSAAAHAAGLTEERIGGIRDGRYLHLLGWYGRLNDELEIELDIVQWDHIGDESYGNPLEAVWTLAIHPSLEFVEASGGGSSTSV